jgi:hypothetical protein
MTQQVGFSIRVRLEWFEQTANLVLSHHAREEIKASLEKMLEDKLSVNGTEGRGTRQKAITILLKTWVTPPKELEPLRDEGLFFLRQLPPAERLVIHWGMVMAVYPFFGIVAAIAGRSLRLQGYVSTAQVLKRVCETMGERETVQRATRRVLRCFVDWGVLVDTQESGICQASPTLWVQDRKISAWLIESVLLSSGSDARTLKAIADAPSLFPFTFDSISPIDVEENSRLELFRQGLDENVVSLRKLAV